MSSKNKQYLGLLNNHLRGRLPLPKLYMKAGELGVSETEVNADIARASEENNGSAGAEQKDGAAAPPSDGG